MFFDLTTVKLEKQIVELFVTKGDYYIPNMILIYDNKESLKEYEGFNFCTVTADKLEELLLKEEKNFKINASKLENQTKHHNILLSEVNNQLLTMGFSPKHTGYSYLVEAIKIVLNKNCVVGSLNNEVYPLICAKYGTTVSNVERNIRNAIVCAFEYYQTYKLKKECNLFSFFSVRPTNREFICMYVHTLNCIENEEVKIINN